VRACAERAQIEALSPCVLRPAVDGEGGAPAMAFFLLHLNTAATAAAAAAASGSGSSSSSTTDTDPHHTPKAAVVFPSAQLLRWHAVLGAILALSGAPRPTTTTDFHHTDDQDPHPTVVMLTALRRCVMFPRCPRRRRTVFQPTAATQITRVVAFPAGGVEGEGEANAARADGGVAVVVGGPATATARVVPAALRGVMGAPSSSATYYYRGEIVGQRYGGLLLELQGRCRLLLTHVPPVDLSVARPGAMVRGSTCIHLS